MAEVYSVVLVKRLHVEDAILVSARPQQGGGGGGGAWGG